jgi:hypothetical protein
MRAALKLLQRCSKASKCEENSVDTDLVNNCGNTVPVASQRRLPA